MSLFISSKGLVEVVTAVVLGVLFCVGSASASGMVECNTKDESKYQAKDVLEKQLTSKGWKVRKIEIDEHCYEVYGTTPNGEKVEAFFNPVTLDTLLVARRGEILFKSEEAMKAVSE